MNVLEIKEQARLHYLSCSTFYNEALMTGELSAVHQYRVSFKRFFALTAFVVEHMDAEASGSLKRLVETVKPVYKRGGKLRDLHVMISFPALHGLIMPPLLYGHLYNKFQKQLLCFMHDNHQPGLPDEASFLAAFNIGIDNSYAGGSDRLTGFTQSNFRRVKVLLENLPGKEWHRARRLIKQNYLLMLMSSSYNSGGFPDEELEWSRNMEQELGIWHDMLNLQRVISNIEPGDLEGTLTRFTRKLEVKKAAKEEEIRKGMDNLKTAHKI